MDNGLIFTSVGNELEEFADSLKYLCYNITVRFCAKMQLYGCKVVIDATDKKTDKTFFNCFLGGLSLHLNHLVASRVANYDWPFGTLPFGVFGSNLDTRDLETYPRTYILGHMSFLTYVNF